MNIPNILEVKCLCYICSVEIPSGQYCPECRAILTEHHKNAMRAFYNSIDEYVYKLSGKLN